MELIRSGREALTLRYWQASLAWKNIGDWAKGWTQESFIGELRAICSDPGQLGAKADQLLDDMIFDRERTPNEVPGALYQLHQHSQASATKEIGSDVESLKVQA